ncbi:MAG: hypothetical protein HC807_05650, partial [Gammaproteobacteria bacterium]|nr:hypothetical protein [Gammaproteobacteria bacterium]
GGTQSRPTPIIRSWSQFDDVLDQDVGRARKPLAERPYSVGTYRAALLASPAYAWKRLTSSVLQRLLLGTGLRRYLFRIWGNTPLTFRNAARPLLRIIGR